MNQNTELLQKLRRIVKFYDTLKRGPCARHGLTSIEFDVLAFLANNPGRDTARDIVELRMLPKGNVSQGVESLIQKGLLCRRQDREDRRRIHLALTPQAQVLLPDITGIASTFQKEAFRGFSREDADAFQRLYDRILDNIAQYGQEEDRA